MYGQISADISDSRLTTTQNLGDLIVPFFITILLIGIAIIINYFIYVYFKKRKVSQDWTDLDNLFVMYELTLEEKSFLRKNLKKFGYSKPTAVLKKKHEFKKLTARILNRPNHHAEFLLKMIEKKVFDNSSKLVKKERTTLSHA